MQNYKINNQINAPNLRVIDEQGNNLGVLSLDAALKLAREKNLDLVEIAPTAQPPVAKIISFDKFRYQKEKEERRQKKAGAGRELKQVRISPRMALHDLNLKVKKTEEFLTKGHCVEINLKLVGREKYNKEWGLKKLNEFISRIQLPHQISMPPKFAGKGFAVQIVKK